MWTSVILFLSFSALLICDSSCKKIDFVVMVDGEGVCNHYRSTNKSVSHDSKKPTRLEVANSTYIVGTKENVIGGQASTNLRIRAKKSDMLRWSGLLGMTIDIVVYDVVGSGGIISTPQFIVENKTSVQPEEFPTVSDYAATYSYVQAKVFKKGSVNCKIRFAIYDRGTEVEQKRLFGYFELDSKLKIE